MQHYKSWWDEHYILFNMQVSDMQWIIPIGAGRQLVNEDHSLSKSTDCYVYRQPNTELISTLLTEIISCA